jgi:shikimate kinase
MSARSSAQKAGRVPKPAADLRIIFLVGFMGSGKSTVGQALSRRLGWRFVDLDSRIEGREKRSITDIFRDSGEVAFREAESSALRELLGEVDSSPVIAALGGGAFAQNANLEKIKSSGAPIVWLDAPVEELWRRCEAEDKGRPLMQSPNQFRQLYEARRAFYMRASLHVDTGGRSQDEVAAEIARRLGFDHGMKEK